MTRPNLSAILARIASEGRRRARCGACGCERFVSYFMRYDYDSQFRERPDQPMDEFYCGCQDQSEY